MAALCWLQHVVLWHHSVQGSVKGQFPNDVRLRSDWLFKPLAIFQMRLEIGMGDNVPFSKTKSMQGKKRLVCSFSHSLSVGQSHRVAVVFIKANPPSICFYSNDPASWLPNCLIAKQLAITYNDPIVANGWCQ